MQLQIFSFQGSEFSLRSDLAPVQMFSFPGKKYSADPDADVATLPSTLINLL